LEIQLILLHELTEKARNVAKIRLKNFELFMVVNFSKRDKQNCIRSFVECQNPNTVTYYLLQMLK
jgi:hypothetical protein